MRFTDEAEATEKMKECCPGQPHVVFSKKAGVKIEFVNPVPHSGLFSRFLVISEGDTHAKIVRRLSKGVKAIKGNGLVSVVTRF